MPPKTKHPEKTEKKEKTKNGGHRGGKGKLIAGIAGLALVAIIISVAVYTYLQSPAVETAVDYTTRIRNFSSDNDGNVTGATNYIYGADTTGMTQAAIDALTYADYTLLGTNTSGESFEYDPNFVYVIMSAASGYNTYWWVPEMGVDNDIDMDPFAANVTMSVLSGTQQTNLKDNAVANTTETNWRLNIQTFDADSINDSVSLVPYLNFTEDAYTVDDLETPIYDNFAAIAISFVKADGADNGTAINANASWISEITGLTADVDYVLYNSSDVLYIELLISVQGLQSLDLVFDDGIGVTYNIRAVEAVYGNEAYAFSHLNYL